MADAPGRTARDALAEAPTVLWRVECCGDVLYQGDNERHARSLVERAGGHDGDARHKRTLRHGVVRWEDAHG